MFPANSHVIRAAGPGDALALHRLAAAAGVRPLVGRLLVAEARGVVVAAISRDEQRTLADSALAPPYLTSLLRARASGLAAYEREPRLAERMRAAVFSPRAGAQLAQAA